MAHFRLVCRAARVASGQFLAVVATMPEGNGKNHTPECDTKTVDSRDEALAACREMAESFTSRLQSLGHSVTGISWR